MKKLEELLLDRMKEKFGEMSSDVALNLAIQSEEFKKMTTPFDPAFSKFAEDQRMLEQYAIILEKNGK